MQAYCTGEAVEVEEVQLDGKQKSEKAKQSRVRSETVRWEQCECEAGVHLCHSPPNASLVQAGSLYCIVTEYAPGGELLGYVRSFKEERLTESQARPFVRQLVSALNYMHERGVVHRDLKMENILLDEAKKTLKIIGKLICLHIVSVIISPLPQTDCFENIFCLLPSQLNLVFPSFLMICGNMEGKFTIPQKVHSFVIGYWKCTSGKFG